MSLYPIVFGKACHPPVEIEHHAYWAVKRCNLAFDQATKEGKLQLVKRFHDNMILRKEFKVGQKVFLFNSCLKLIAGKLRSKWDGPFLITNPHEEEIEIIRMKNENENEKKEVKVGTAIKGSNRDKLLKLLSNYVDTFAWTYKICLG
ncbi:hypothetical protein CR513_05949, partial [Mucuna pruriens]